MIESQPNCSTCFHKMVIYQIKSETICYQMQAETIQTPKSYLDLMKIVGDNGRYQRNVTIMFFLIFFIGCYLLYMTPFLFLKRQFRCQELGFPSGQCERHLCQTDRNNIESYLSPNQLYSIADQFGPFYCEQTSGLNILQMSFFLGTILSLALFSVSDKMGRKKGFLLGWSLTIFGLLIFVCALNMIMVCTGLFIAGMGGGGALLFCYMMLAQIMDNESRQKNTMLLECTLSLTMVVMAASFWVISHWRIVMIIFVFIPSLVFELCLIFYIEETPKYLIADSKEKAVDRLNRIGRINQSSNLVTLDDIEKVLSAENESVHFQDIDISLLDLFRYASLRWKTIAVILITITLTMLNLGPIIILGKVGMNIFVNAIGIGLIETVGFGLTYLFIQRLPRKLTMQIAIAFGFFQFAILIFIKHNPKYLFAFENVFQLVMLLISRIDFAFIYSILSIDIAQLYPMRVRGIGYGLFNIVFSLSEPGTQYAVLELQATAVSPMVLITATMLVGFFATFLIPETLGLPLQDEIQEIEAYKLIYKAAHIDSPGSIILHQ